MRWNSVKATLPAALLACTLGPGALAADGRLATRSTVVGFADAVGAVAALADGTAVGKQVVQVA